MTNFDRVKQEMRIEDVAIFGGLPCKIIHKLKNEENCSDRACTECPKWLAEEYVEHIKAKRNPINSCADLSRSMRGRRYGILYFTEEFRIDFENKMCELNRIKELEMEIQAFDCISKDKIKAKLSKLEKEFDYYANRNPYEFEDGEFDGEQCNDIAIKIGVLKELLEE